MRIIEAQDAFLQNMFSRMSPGAEELFSSRQIDEIRRAFGARSTGSHAIEWRTSLRLLRRSYYVVFLVGRERRSTPRVAIRIPGIWLEAAAVALIAFVVLGVCL
jgi:hypothetical protein